MKYDYYGNYNKNEESYTFSINEIHKKQKDREKNRTKIYENIASRCFKKIKETSLNEESFCFFRIPEYIPGLPIYNITECVMFLLNILHEKGFSARYCDSFYIFISWTKTYNKLEDTPPQKKSIIDNLNLKYKPIENYTAFGNFLPRKK
jgi:hypothetical protein